MRSLRLAAVSLGLAVVPLLPTAAAAVPPTGSCPKPFTLLDRAGLVALATEIRPGQNAEELADAVLVPFDKNRDDALCVDVREIRGGQDKPAANFIDNVVPPRG